MVRESKDDGVFEYEELDDEEDALTVIDEERSCMNCTKRNTCVIFQKAGFLHPDRWEGPDDPPIRQDELAVTCDEFEAKDGE